MKDTLDLGDDHVMVFSEYLGQARVGASVKHKKPDGTPCQGWIAFSGRSWAESFAPGAIATWDVAKDEPLTLTPSILCRGCGDHGFITGGKWVRA